MTDPNLLYYGDNLDVLRRHVRAESVDLVYLDPPFNSNANYNLLFAEHGEKAAAQVRAFEDTWVWDTTARLAYEEVVEAGGRVAETMRAFRTMLGASDMLAYLAMMAPRLAELHRVLKPTGSLYLHCDPTASHYLKLLLDAVFGPKFFRNEIVWKRTATKGDARRRYGAVHDVILFYGRGLNPGFQAQDVPHGDEYSARFTQDDADGRGPYEGAPLDSPNPRPNLTYAYKGYPPPGNGWRVSLEVMEQLDADKRLIFPANREGRIRRKNYLWELSGRPVGDVWTDVSPINSQARERLGYPTQKPIALLERIIQASSNAGDVVLDPFCGCGTAIDAAQSLNRRWIGIDITHLAIGLIKHRLVDRYGPEIAKTYRVIGEPTTVDDARVLARDDAFQFQAWALGLVGARVAGSDKRGGDKGIDGRLYFHEGVGDSRQIIFSVKAGHLVPAFVRDLRGVLEREKAEIGVLISFEEPTAGMRAEAAEAGFHTSPWGKHPRIQLRTVGELLEGRGVDYPHVTGANVTHRRAARARADEPAAMQLFEEP